MGRGSIDGNNRIPEAALMARSYLPNKVSEIVALWTKDLNKVNQKVVESLADPEEYPDMFEEWQIALEVEGKAAETRYPQRMLMGHHRVTGLHERLIEGIYCAEVTKYG
ncbi:Coatomer, WD associated region [Artemisia annua]|uniref:Coatomer, WD associated region n=1 Tax=Artemisia annua TaxID=35608 RepID=A0A2U1Q063_ARTAN|nr:Coatomer, WD associated region [Artemisia annua]